MWWGADRRAGRSAPLSFSSQQNRTEQNMTHEVQGTVSGVVGPLGADPTREDAAMTTSPFDTARKRFAEAQEAMEAAAIAELGRIIHETHPDAVEAHTRGEYTDAGDLSIELVAIKTPAGVVDDVDVIEGLDEEARDALRYLIVTMDEGYLGEQEIILGAPNEIAR